MSGASPLKCGEAADSHGPVIGCCFRCGKLLCERHLYHLPRSAAFDRSRPARPLVCEAHADRGGRPGPPSKRRPQSGARTTGPRRHRG